MRSNPRLLIVGDDSARMLGRLVFASRGWRVDEAATLSEGLSILSDRDQPAPDYVILDLRLPDGPGSELVRRVREAGIETRVAFLTDPGLDEADGVPDLRPASIFVRKPFPVADVWREGVLAASGVAC